MKNDGYYHSKSSPSLQNIRSEIRDYLTLGLYVEVDTINSVYAVLNNYSMKSGLSTDVDGLNYYCNNRDEILNKFTDKDKGKLEMIKLITSNKSYLKVSDFKDVENFNEVLALIKLIKSDKKIITDSLSKNEELLDKTISSLDSEKIKKGSFNASLISYYLATYYRSLYETIKITINSAEEFESIIPHFDGVYIEVNQNNDYLIESVESGLKNSGFCVPLKIKEIVSNFKESEKELSESDTNVKTEKVFDNFDEENVEFQKFFEPEEYFLKHKGTIVGSHDYECGKRVAFILKDRLICDIDNNSTYLKLSTGL